MGKDEMLMSETICPIRHVLDVVGGKWKLPVLCILSDGKPLRYNTIKRKLGKITNMMLSQSLKELENYGMIKRIQYNEVPPRVEYLLTDKGKSLIPILSDIAEWGTDNMISLGESTFCSVCVKIN